MNDLDTRYLDLFPSWLETLGSDVGVVSAAIEDDTTSRESKRWLLTALNYLFKSLDLIPDGIEDLGFIDDAFILRICVRHATAEGAVGGQRLQELAEEVSVIEQFLQTDFPRMQAFVAGLPEVAVFGNTAAMLLDDAEKQRELLASVAGFARQYEPPSFAPVERNLIKLRSFMTTKLPTLD